VKTTRAYINQYRQMAWSYILSVAKMLLARSLCRGSTPLTDKPDTDYYRFRCNLQHKTASLAGDQYQIEADEAYWSVESRDSTLLYIDMR